MSPKHVSSINEFLLAVRDITRQTREMSPDNKSEYIFRGQGIYCDCKSKKYNNCSLKDNGLAYADEASAYCICITPSSTRRFIMQCPELQPITKTHLLRYHLDLLREAKMKGFHKKDGEKMSDMELIADLQHFGCATMLLDFSRNPLVALYFAASSNVDNDFVVFMMDISNKSKYADIELERVEARDTKGISTILLQSNTLVYYWEPSFLNNRIPTQHSIFICGETVIPSDLYIPIIISKECKSEILDELKNTYHIDDVSLFNDLPGFALANDQNKKVDSSFVRTKQAPRRVGGVSDFKAELEEDIKKIDSAMERDKSNVSYFERGLINNELRNYEEAIKDFTELLNLEPNNVYALNGRGNAKVGLGRYQEAIEDYNESVRIDPKYIGTYSNRGYANSMLGKLDEAMKDYNEALRLDPRTAQAYCNRGLTRANLGQYEEAIKDYDEAIRLNPRLVQALNNRGSLKVNLGHPEEAIGDFDEIIRIDPKNVLAYLNRGNAHTDLGNLEAAMKDYDEAIRLDSRIADTFNNRGSLKMELGRYLEALSDFDEAIKISPTFSIAYYNRGETKTVLGNFDEAIADYNEAIRLDPNNAWTYIARSCAYLKTGKAEKALDDCNTAISLDSEQSLAFVFRSIANLLLGDIVESRRDYEKAVQIANEQDDQQAKKEIAKCFDKDGNLLPDWNIPKRD